MRDGLSRPSSLRNPTGTSTPSGDVSVDRWRARLRAGVLGELAEAAKGIVWNHELLMALLEELHVTEEFDRLIGRSRLDVVRDAPRLLALALFLRHSWDPADLSTVVDPVLGPPSRTGTHSSPTTRGDRGHRPSPTRPRAVLKKARTKGAAMTDTTVSRPRTPRGHRVRELVCSYRTLRDGNGHVLDVPTLALSNPRVAASTLGGLLAGELVEVFAVACLSTRHRLLSWHVVSRGTRTSTPISIPDVFVPACLTPGTTGLIVVHNHPSGDPTPSVDDARLTIRLCAAADVLELPLIDHLIVGDTGRYFSFRESGRLNAADRSGWNGTPQ